MQKHVLNWRTGIWAGVSCNCGQCGREIASIQEMNDSAFDPEKDMEIVNKLRIHMQQNHFLCPICPPRDSDWIKTQQGWKRHITLKHKQQQ